MTGRAAVVVYFLKRYWLDIVTAVVAIASSYAAFRWASTSRVQLLASVTITLLATIVIILLRTRETDFHYLPLRQPSEKNNWAGYGVFEYTRMDRCFRITGSDSGFIFTRALNWSDYRVRFRFKILNKCLGVIVRAVNLSNLVMLQIGESRIRPHIRINGAWHVWEAAEVNIPIEPKLDLTFWHECLIQCDKEDVRITITRNGHIICDTVWRIPRGSVNFVLPEASIYSGGAYEPVKAIPFMINLEFGTAGFRNDADEQALVRDVLIEKLGHGVT